MNANESTCHPVMERMTSTGYHAWLSRCCDSISSKSFNSFDEKTHGAAKPDVARRPWQSIPTFASSWSS